MQHCCPQSLSPATVSIFLMCGNRRDNGLQTVFFDAKSAYALITFINVPTPSILIIRFMLYARTCKLISVLTRALVLVSKCVAPIHALMVPNGCSTVCRRIRIASGVRSSRSCMASSTDSCSHRATRRRVECAQIAADARCDLFHASLQLGAGEVAVTVVDGLEFAAVNGHQRFREEAKPLA